MKKKAWEPGELVTWHDENGAVQVGRITNVLSAQVMVRTKDSPFHKFVLMSDATLRPYKENAK